MRACLAMLQHKHSFVSSLDSNPKYTNMAKEFENCNLKYCLNPAISVIFKLVFLTSATIEYSLELVIRNTVGIRNFNMLFYM